ncbi:MAG: tRNA (N6-isopentenyl adenosine(37)-C2)-methylthiotransferase MiaB [Proteobacteria bacterium]|nr:tRNA (N6-isopentenyl adenosine(37)-C2)-methylthiotransferase MiaB [Pseudomonadota bacterium]
MKVLIETYGCQMNTADSELIMGILNEAGFESAHTLDEADVIILNTCAVREKAEARILGRLTNLVPFKRLKKGLMIGVVGCMAKHLGDKLVKERPYVDFIAGPDQYRNLPEMIHSKRKKAVVQTEFDRSEVYTGCTPTRPRGVTAWVTIQRGCNYVCTYCIVPHVRGAERNVPAADILAEVKRLAAEGFSVVTLLGQTVNSYQDGDVNFAKLLRMVAQVEGIEQVRFTSPHPLGFSDELIDVIATEPHVAKFVHLPLQSASDSQLALMRRKYTFEEYQTIVRKLREKCPEIAISTDIIVGFCGESEEDYQRTKQALIDNRYAFAFLFAYSERSLAIAAKTMKDDVPADVKQKRLAEIIDIQQNISKEIYSSFIGKRVEVIVEGYSRRNADQAVGNTRDFKTTIFERGTCEPGDWVEVEIESATSQTLVGHIVRVIQKSRPVQVQEQIDVGISLGPTDN